MLWDRWLVDYRSMTKDNFVNFVEYKEKVLAQVNISNNSISKEDLLKEAEEIERKISQKRGEE